MLFVIDLEAGGSDPLTSGLWELAAVLVRDGRIAAEWESRVWPGREFLQPEHRAVMQQVSGQDPEAIVRLLDQDVPEVPVARERLLHWMFAQAGAKRQGEDIRGERCTADGCSGGQLHRSVRGVLQPDGFCGVCRGSGYRDVPRVKLRLTSFNREADSKFLQAVQWSLPYFCRALGHAEIEWAPCVMLAASDYLGERGKLPRSAKGAGYRWPRLSLACEMLGVPFQETHRALADARAAAEIAVRLGMA